MMWLAIFCASMTIAGLGLIALAAVLASPRRDKLGRPRDAAVVRWLP